MYWKGPNLRFGIANHKHKINQQIFKYHLLCCFRCVMMSHVSLKRYQCDIYVLIVTRKIYLSFVWSRVLFLSSFTVVVDLSKSMISLQSLFHLFQIVVSKMFPYKSITLNHSLSNLIISSQRLVKMSVSLHTQTVLHCLIIQVLNIKSLLPKCLIQSLSLLYVII